MAANASPEFILPRLVVALRQKAEITQTELAGRLGLSASAVNQVERGAHGLQETAFIKYVTAIGFADELDALEAGCAALRAQKGEAKPRPRKPSPGTTTTKSSKRKPAPKKRTRGR